MTWEALFFDLDGTLYHPEQGLWQAVGRRIEAFLQQYLGLSPQEARQQRLRFAERYGTTLRGLQEEHGLDPWEYLTYVGQVPVEEYIHPDPHLRTLLASLPYPKWVFTNADAPYARRVLRSLGVEDLFQGIIDIQAMGWVPKPQKEAFRRAWAAAGVRHPARTLLVDDLVRNVRGALEAGMAAVLVHPQPPAEPLPWIPSLEHLPAWLNGHAPVAALAADEPASSDKQNAAGA